MISIGRISMVKVVVAICILLSMLIIPAKPSYATSYGYRTYPEGNVGITKPEIGAKINFADLKPTYQFFLNGQEQKATYDSVNSQYSYVPSADLKPGEYKAQLVFSMSGYEPMYLNWTFTILPNATQVSTELTKEQQEGLKAINDHLAKLGHSAVKLNSALNTAAQKHAEYLYQNKIDPIHNSVSLHDENASLPGFIGQTLKERSQYVSYRHGIAEDVAYVHATLTEAIDSLFDAPYHRTPFMTVGLFEVGIYTKGDYHVVEFGIELGKSPELDVSPKSNDFYVPTHFDGHEVPDPIRNYPKAEYPVGYPIMAVVNDFEVTKVSNIVAELRDSNGNKIPIWINSSENDDHLDHEVMLIPQEPLQLDTTYKAWVSLKATMKDGSIKPFTKEWRFRTEPKEGLGLLTLHKDSAMYGNLMNTTNSSVLNRNHFVTFGLNADTYYLDQIPFPMKKKPYITDGTSYLYIRDLAAAIGATVEWDDSNKAAIYKKKDMTVIFYTNRNAYAINGKEYPTDSAAKLIDETTMIPVRLLSETLGAKVDYVEISRTVVIHF